MNTSEKIELITKLKDGSLEVKFQSGKVSILPGGESSDNSFSKNYCNLTVQAALIFAIVNKKEI